MRILACWILFAGTALAAEAPPRQDVSTSTSIRILAHPDLALEGSTNLIWCDTLQVAWNEAIRLVGEPLIFDLSNASDLSGLQQELGDLNRQQFTTADLPPGSCVALADFERNHVEDEIHTALRQTFGDANIGELVPTPPAQFLPDDFVAYACLLKTLKFKVPFERQSDVLAFAGTPVRSFGIDASSQLPATAHEQVEVCDYLSTDNFVIRIATADLKDQLMLAKIPSGQTMQESIQDVLARVQAGGHSDFWVRSLAIPQINFNLLSTFPELSGLPLRPDARSLIHSSKLVSVPADDSLSARRKGRGAEVRGSDPRCRRRAPTDRSHL